MSIFSFLSGREDAAPRGGKLVIGNAQAKGPPNTADYVDWLLADILRAEGKPFQIIAATPLPSTPHGDGAPWLYRLPGCQAVVNRLKILCGRNPLPFTAPVEGEIIRPRGDHVLAYTVIFDDQAAPPVCTVRVQVRRRAAPPARAPSA